MVIVKRYEYRKTINDSEFQVFLVLCRDEGRQCEVCGNTRDAVCQVKGAYLGCITDPEVFHYLKERFEAEFIVNNPICNSCLFPNHRVKKQEELKSFFSK